MSFRGFPIKDHKIDRPKRSIIGILVPDITNELMLVLVPAFEKFSSNGYQIMRIPRLDNIDVLFCYIEESSMLSPGART